MDSDSVAKIGFGAIFILPAVPIMWKSASLRGDTHEKWAARVDIAIAGLSDRAMTLLADLRSEIDHLLAGQSAPTFDPIKLIVDPSPIAKKTRTFNRVITAKNRLKRRFRMMINLCAAAPVLCGIYILGALAALFNDLGWIRRPAWIGTFGLVLAAIGLGLGVMLVLMNAYLNWKLANAEIMSRVGSKGTGGTS